MSVPTAWNDLSTTAASNQPAGSETASTMDDHFRQVYAFLRTLYDEKAGSSAVALTGTSTYQTNEIGWRSVVRSTTSVTAVVGDRAKCVAVSAAITVPASTFSAGDAFSVYNDSASAISVKAGVGLTLRLAGTTTTGDRTLAARGLATVWFNSATEAICSGAGVT